LQHKLFFFNQKVQQTIEAWPKGIYASFLRITEQMQISGPDLGLPYTRAMGRGLFEIRAHGQEGIARAMYCCLKGQRIVVLHGFIKKTQTTQERDLKMAISRLKVVQDENF
jgi:phage-related protein